MNAFLRSLLPRSIQPRRILTGPLRGSWLVTSWHDYPAGVAGRTERPLLDWMAQHVRTGETWLDIGAHYGYTAFALAKQVGPAGRVFAFEPIVASAGCVDRGRMLNGVRQLTVLPFGLGAPESFELRRVRITRGMADATLPDGAGDEAAIPVARFDWLWPTLDEGRPEIHGIKIDVQGMELEVLAGMRETLQRLRPRLVIELHSGVSRSDVLSLLRSLGYSPNALPIEPVAGEDAPQFVDNRSYAFHPA